jgi:hypothetical protein
MRILYQIKKEGCGIKISNQGNTPTFDHMNKGITTENSDWPANESRI